jgi:hypothetical protein
VWTVLEALHLDLGWLESLVECVTGVLFPGLVVSAGPANAAPARARGASPATAQLGQGESQGLGTTAVWEADIGLMRPPISRASAPPLADGRVATLSTPEHPDLGWSLRIPHVKGQDIKGTVPRFQGTARIGEPS